MHSHLSSFIKAGGRLVVLRRPVGIGSPAAPSQRGGWQPHYPVLTFELLHQRGRKTGGVEAPSRGQQPRSLQPADQRCRASWRDDGQCLVQLGEHSLSERGGPSNRGGFLAAEPVSLSGGPEAGHVRNAPQCTSSLTTNHILRPRRICLITVLHAADQHPGPAVLCAHLCCTLTHVRTLAACRTAMNPPPPLRACMAVHSRTSSEHACMQGCALAHAPPPRAS